MRIKNYFWVVALAIFLASCQGATANSTPVSEATPEITAEATSSISVAPVTEFEEFSVGSIKFTRPKEWLTFTLRDGSFVVTNINIEQAGDQDYPDETVVIRVNTLTTDMLRDEPITDNPDVKTILELVTAEQSPNLAIETLDINGVTLARADLSNAQSKQNAYVAMLTPKMFAIISTFSPGATTLTDLDEAISQVIASLTVDMSAPFPENTTTVYADIPQSISAEGFPQLGNPNAKVVIYEVGSFDCSHCKDFHESGLPIVLERVKKGEVLFIYVPIFGTGGIPNGDKAASAALCALQQDKFWEYHDGAYGWQSYGALAFADERLEAGAEALDLDMEAFKTCYAENTFAEQLRSNYEYASSIPNFRGTPTIIVNGTMVTWSPPNQFDASIDAAFNAPEITSEATAEATQEN